MKVLSVNQYIYIHILSQSHISTCFTLSNIFLSTYLVWFPRCCNFHIVEQGLHWGSSLRFQALQAKRSWSRGAQLGQRTMPRDVFEAIAASHWNWDDPERLCFFRIFEIFVLPPIAHINRIIWVYIYSIFLSIPTSQLQGFFFIHTHLFANCFQCDATRLMVSKG